MSSPGYKNGASQDPSLPTHLAALQNNVQTLEQLIKQGEELMDDSTGESPFHAAARGGSIDVIRWLLENVTAVTPRDKATNGHTPAHVAAVYGHMGALRAILEYNKKQGGLIAADQDRNGLTILHLAVLQGDDEMLRYILNNYPHLAFCSNENGDLPVHFAAAQGNLEVIQTLVDTCGAQIVNEKDSNGTNAVYFAAQEGKLECLQYFLDVLHADPACKDNEGLTLLHAATQGEHLDMVQYLVPKLGRQGVRATTKDGATVIHTAADIGSADILAWLLEQPGCEDLANAQDVGGYTPAHDAVESNKLDALMVLLKHGAILSLKNADGKTPLDCAQSDTMLRFIQDYNEKGPSVFPGYKQLLRTTEGVSIRSFPSERRGSAAKIRTAAHTSMEEKMEIDVARRAASEVMEKSLRRQESLQALQSVGEDSDEEDKEQSLKLSSKVGRKRDPTLSHDGVDRYKADDGAVYSMVKKTSKGRFSDVTRPSPKKLSRNTSGGASDLSDFSSHLSDQLSPHGRTSRTSNPLADDSRLADDEERSIYSQWTSVSARPMGDRGSGMERQPQHSQRTNMSGYSSGMPMQHPYMPAGYPGYPPHYMPMYPPPPGHAPPRSMEERMRNEAIQGRHPPHPPHPSAIPYPYPQYRPPMPMKGRGRGYPYMGYPYMYPGYYPPYPGGAPPQAGKGKSAGSSPGSKINLPIPKFGKKKKTSKEAASGSPLVADSGMRHSQTDHDIGYGPISSTDGPASNAARPHSAKGKLRDEVPEGFHPPPPPITKGGQENEEFVEHGHNFILAKPSIDPLSPKVHQGIQLHIAKQTKEYDGRYDKYIEPDPYDEEVDAHFNIGVLVEAVTVVMIGPIAGIKDLRRSLSTIQRKGKQKSGAGKASGDTGKKGKKQQIKKASSVQDLWEDELMAETTSVHSQNPYVYDYLADTAKPGWGQEEEEAVPRETHLHVNTGRERARLSMEDRKEEFVTDMVQTLHKQYSSRNSLVTAGETNIGLGLSLEGRHSSLLNLASSSHYGGSRYNTDDEDDDFGDISKMMEVETRKEVSAQETEDVTQRKLKKKKSTEGEEEPEGKPPVDREGETKKTQPAEGEGKKKERSKEKKAKKTTSEGEEKKATKEKRKDRAPSSSAGGEESTIATATMATTTMATTTVVETQHKLVKGEAEMKDGTQPSQEMGEETVQIAFGVRSAKEDARAQGHGSRTPPSRGKKEVKHREQPTTTPPSSVEGSKGKSPLVKRWMYVQQQGDQHADGSPVLNSKQLKEFHQEDLEEEEGRKKPVTISAQVSLSKVSAEQRVQVQEQFVVDQPVHAMDVVMEKASSPKGEPSKMKKQSVELVSAGQHKEPSYVAEVVVPKDVEVEEKVQQFSFIDSDEEEEREAAGHADKRVQRKAGQSDKPEAEEVGTQEVHQPHPQEVVKPEDTVVQQEAIEKGSEGVEVNKEKEKKKKKKKKTSEQVVEEPAKIKGKKKKKSSTSKPKAADGAAPPAASEASSAAPPWASGFSLPMFDMQMGMETHLSSDKPPEDNSLSADIFGELAKSSSVGDILKDIEDQIREMETGLSDSPSGTQPPSSQPLSSQVVATPAHQVGQGRNEQSPFEGTIHDLARELEKLGESELGSVGTTSQSAMQHQQAQASRRRMAQQEVTVHQQTQTIIEDYLVQKLVEVNRTLTDGGENLPSWDLVQLQQEHNQLVQMVIAQALSAKETGLDTQALAQGIATALHQLDHFTISQIMGGINQGKMANTSLMDMHQSGLDHSDSSISLTSEIEAAMRRFQEEQLKEQQKHFKSQEEFQEAIKRQMEEQMRVYQQMQSQSRMFAEMQSVQFQQMADRQRQMNDQESRLRQTEDRLMARIASQEKSAVDVEKERKLQELELKVKMYEDMKQQQESYHKQFQGYYENKMEELMAKLSQQEEAGRQKKSKDKKKKKVTEKVVVSENYSESSDDELVPAVPSLKQQILQHKEAKEHQARIHRTEMLTEESVKEFSEAKIPPPPPLPPQSYLLKSLQRKDTRYKVNQLYDALDRFEHGEPVSEGDDQFVTPNLQKGETKKASLKRATGTEVLHASHHRTEERVAQRTAVPTVTTTTTHKGARATRQTAQVKKVAVRAHTDEKPFEDFQILPARKPVERRKPVTAPEPAGDYKNRFLDNEGSSIDKINAHKSSSPPVDHTLEGANNELKAVFLKRRKGTPS